MSFTVQNLNENIITITNEDISDPLLYTIYVLGDDNVFAPVDGYPEDPTESLAASTSVELDLEDDGIYQILTDSIYYFFLNKDLRACEKNYLGKVLCNTCDPCDEVSVVYMKDLLRFYALRDRFYFIANKYAQDQSIVDFLDPDDAEVFYWSNLLTQLTTLCDNCYNAESSTLDEDCGCS